MHTFNTHGIKCINGKFNDFLHFTFKLAQIAKELLFFKLHDPVKTDTL